MKITRINGLKSRLSILNFILVLSLLGVTLINSSCNKNEETIPSLTIINNTSTSENKSVTSVRLVGYDFTKLNIRMNNSQTFTLNDGMPGGFEKINVIIRLSGPQIIVLNKDVDFKNGQATTITVRGCISAEGCNGYWLE